MATKTFHPTSDYSLEHGTSTGSSGYSLLGSNDGDSTYIKGGISSTSNTSYTSQFKVSGAFGTSAKINSIQVCIVARTNATSTDDTASLNYNLYLNGIKGQTQSATLTTDYYTLYSKTYTSSTYDSTSWASLFDGTYTDISQIDPIIWIKNSGKKNSTKSDDFIMYTTEAYLVVTYEDLTASTYTASIGAQPSIGSATVSSSSNHYGDSVTFSATVPSGKEFWGWYSDANYTTLISTSNPYTTTQPASNLTLYPYINDPKYEATITCSHIMDVKPFRFNAGGSYANGAHGNSYSVIKNASNIIGRTSLSGSVYAEQANPEYESDFAFGISFHFNGNTNSLPDDAIIQRIEGHIGLATGSGSQYYNMNLYAGTMIYQDYHNTSINYEPDETPAIQSHGATTKTISVNAMPTDYIVPYTQMGTWTAAEIKSGLCGMELDFSHSGSASTLNIYLAKLVITYTRPHSYYNCTANQPGNCDVYVMNSASNDYHQFDNTLTVKAGNACTYYIRPHGAYRFVGWYSDSACNNLVSTSATYTFTPNGNITLYPKVKCVARIITKSISIPFGSGTSSYDGYYADDGVNLTSTNSGSNGFQTDLDLTTGIYAFINVDTQASIGATNGKNVIYALLKDSVKANLFPNSTAHPTRLDQHFQPGRGAASIMLASSISNTLRNPLTPPDIIGTVYGPNSDNTLSGGYRNAYRPALIQGLDCYIINDTNDYIRNLTQSSRLGYALIQASPTSRSKAIGVDETTYTLYFEEYDFVASVGNGVNAISSATVSRNTGYEGDSVTFSAIVAKGATWSGWYSDAACTNRVSTSQSYTVTPNASLTLYAKATASNTIYSCTAYKNSNAIASATPENTKAVVGQTITFTAVAADHATFEGWYSDSGYTNRVSENTSYTVTVNNNITLYAKGNYIIYHITMPEPIAGTAIATPTNGIYGTPSTIQWTDNKWGWYDFTEWKSSEIFTPSVQPTLINKNNVIFQTFSKGSNFADSASMDTPFTIGSTNIPDGYAIYCRQDAIYSINSTNIDARSIRIVNTSSSKIRTGSENNTYALNLVPGDSVDIIFDGVIYQDVPLISSSGLVNETTTLFGDANVHFVAQTPADQYPFVLYITSLDATSKFLLVHFIMLWTPTRYAPDGNEHTFELYIHDDNNFSYTEGTLSTNNPLNYTITDNVVIKPSLTLKSWYQCNAVEDAGTQITSNVYQGHVVAETTATFTAIPREGYTFDGWYSDAEYQNLLSSDAAYSITPTEATTIYAKSTQYSVVTTQVYIKQDGDYLEAARIYKYIDGMWQEISGTVARPYIQTQTMRPHLYRGSWIADTSLVAQSAGTTSLGGWTVTPYIPVPSGCTNITVKASGTHGGACIHEYDANLNYLSYWGSSGDPRTFTFDYPTTVKYIRATFNTDDLAYCYIYDNNNDEYIFKGNKVT